MNLKAASKNERENDESTTKQYAFDESDTTGLKIGQYE